VSGGSASPFRVRAVVAVCALVVLAAAPARSEDAGFAPAIRAAAVRYPAADAHLAVGDAFLRFESSPLDADLKGRDPSLYRDLEVRWLALAAAMKAGAPAADVRAQADALAAVLDRVVDTPASGSSSSLFVDGMLIILREGFEAILVLTALAAYLVKVGQPDKRWLLWSGAGAAVLASLALAAIAAHVVPVEASAREALEGATMLLAAVVLFSASFWLISKSEARRWQAFVRDKLEGALSSRRRAALAFLAFMVVFREGFETVLFYQALVGRAGQAAMGASAVGGGFLVGAIVLTLVALALFRYGVRIPIRPFFAVTGALLYLLAFKFAGGGVRELQEAGLVRVTPAAIPDLTWLRDWLAVYPFVEPLAAQSVLLVALIGGGLYALAGRGHRSEVDAGHAARS